MDPKQNIEYVVCKWLGFVVEIIVVEIIAAIIVVEIIAVEIIAVEIIVVESIGVEIIVVEIILVDTRGTPGVPQGYRGYPCCLNPSLGPLPRRQPATGDPGRQGYFY